MLHTQKSRADRILAVDDVPDNLFLIEAILEDEGYEVILVKDGQSALEQLQRSPFDLILLDIMMPGIDSNGPTSCALDLPLDTPPRYLSFVEPGLGKQMYIDTVGNESFAQGMVVQEWSGLDKVQLSPCR